MSVAVVIVHGLEHGAQHDEERAVAAAGVMREEEEEPGG